MSIALNNNKFTMRLIKWSILSGSLLMFLAVLLGAFGAHALADVIQQNNRQDAFDTASKYHFYHGLALIVFGVLITINDRLKFQTLTFLSFLIGCIIFSGSLYVLAVLNASWLGAIAPIGGGLLLLGWGSLIYSVLLNSFDSQPKVTPGMSRSE